MILQKIGFSPGQRLENLYVDIFEDIYPQIKNQKKKEFYPQ